MAPSGAKAKISSGEPAASRRRGGCTGGRGKWYRYLLVVNSQKARPAQRSLIVAALGRGLSLAVLIGLAVAVAAIVARYLDHRIDPTLHVSTDVIGYPTFNAFNPSVYVAYYELAVLVFPAVCVASFFGGLWVWRRLRVPLPVFTDRRATRTVDAADAAPVQPGDMVAFLAAGARLGLVGGILGLAASIARHDAPSTVWRSVLLAAAAYIVVIGAVSALLARRRSKMRWQVSLRTQMGRLNAAGACLTLAGLLAASQNTQVTVLSDHTVHHYAWMPNWLGIVVVAVALVLTARALRRARSNPTAVARVERRLVFLVAVPVFLFLGLAFIFGELGNLDAFETGQSLTTLRLVQAGLFPWRDWISTHGILEDAFQTMFTSAAIQDSNWGTAAGRTLLVRPLCLLSFYFLAYRVFGKRWLLLAPALGVLLLVTELGYVVIFVRFAFWPLLLVLLWFVLERRRRRLAFGLGAALVVQAVISPETAYCIPAAGLAVLGSDLYATGWRRANMRLRTFTATLWTALGGAAVGAVLVVVLLSQHALGAFVNYYTAFAPDHILTGGLPHLPLTGKYLMELLVPIIAMLVAFFLVVAKLWLRARLTTLDWLLIAAAILEFLYYPKFLDRADFHVDAVFATCVPLLIVLIGEAADLGLPPLARLFQRRRRLGTALALAALVAVVALLFPIAVNPAVTQAPVSYRTTVSSEPRFAALGYATANALDPTLVGDVSTLLHAYLPAGGHVFDFSNEPAFLYYVLDFRPSTAYYQVSIAMREVIQKDLISQLKADHPLFVLFTQKQLGIPGWDGIPNMVRHYDVSQYILSHYRPFADVHGQIVYVLDTATVPDPSSLHLPLSAPLVTTGLEFLGSSCDWRDAPNFLSVRPAPPSPGASPVAVAVRRTGPTSLQLTLPAGHRWADYRWIELDAATKFTTSQMTIADRPSTPTENRAITFSTLPTGPTAYRFPIGACSQWPGYGSEPLQLTMSTAEAIGSIRLIP